MQECVWQVQCHSATNPAPVGALRYDMSTAGRAENKVRAAPTDQVSNVHSCVSVWSILVAQAVAQGEDHVWLYI